VNDAPLWLRILRVATCMPSETWTKADLAVACWIADPDAFGLTGYREKYPDAQRVYSKVDGAAGLIHRGYLEQLDPKLVTITKRGRAVAARGHESVTRALPDPGATPLTAAGARAAAGMLRRSKGRVLGGAEIAGELRRAEGSR
jgi:hypothetical protein